MNNQSQFWGNDKQMNLTKCHNMLESKQNKSMTTTQCTLSWWNLLDSTVTSLLLLILLLLLLYYIALTCNYPLKGYGSPADCPALADKCGTWTTLIDEHPATNSGSLRLTFTDSGIWHGGIWDCMQPWLGHIWTVAFAFWLDNQVSLHGSCHDASTMAQSKVVLDICRGRFHCISWKPWPSPV